MERCCYLRPLYFYLLWTVWWTWAVMYISLRLGSDLEIRIQRKLCSDTATFFFVLQRQLIKLSANHRWMLNAAAVLILASRLKVVTSFFWPSQRVPRLWSAQRTLWSMRLSPQYGSRPKQGLRFREGSENRLRRGDRKAKPELKFFKLVCVCLQCRVGAWESVEGWHWKRT